LKSDEEVLSIKAKEHWYYITALLSSIVRDYKSATTIYAEAISFLESNQHIIKKTKILIMISNHLYFCALSGDKKSFDVMLNKLETLLADKDYDRIYIHYIKYSRILELQRFFKQSQNANEERSMELHFFSVDSLSHFK